MEQIVAAALGAFGVIIVALIGLYGARKLGIGESQEKLVATLKELIAAQDKKIEELEEEQKADRLEIQELRREVKSLRELTIEQAKTIQQLTRQARGGVM